jgi:hypothetical protein
MLMDLHYAGVLLNPYLKDVLEMRENGDAKHVLNKVVHKLRAVFEILFNDAMAELTKYEEHRDPYNPLKALDIWEPNMEPHEWCHRVGGKTLLKIAFGRSHALHHHVRGIGAYTYLHTARYTIALGVNKAEALM